MSHRYSCSWISFNPSSRTTLGWPNLTSSQEFPPQQLAPLYPSTHATEDIISPTMVHMLLSPSITYSIFPKQSPLLSTHITGLYLDISSKTHQWHSGSLLWIPIHVNNLQNKSFILPLPSLCTWFEIGAQISPLWWNSSNVWELCRFMLVRYQCIKTLGGGVWT